MIYKYFQEKIKPDNQLKAEGQCGDEKNDPPMNINRKFMKGRMTYFKEKYTKEKIDLYIGCYL